LKNRNKYERININVEKDNVTVILDEIIIKWPSSKGLKGNINLDVG